MDKNTIARNDKEFLTHIKKNSQMQNFLQRYDRMLFKYRSALNETVTKLEILNEDFNARYQHSPINKIESRIKDSNSLIKKMLSHGVEFNTKDLQAKIFDIAGVRVVCPFLSDVYTLIKMIRENDDIIVVKEKDYIQNPKPSGYRSYHMILKIPIHLTTGVVNVPVEIQIRTMAMDFWASLEHKIKYKFDGQVPISVKNELIRCAEEISITDRKMMELNYKVREANTHKY